MKKLYLDEDLDRVMTLESFVHLYTNCNVVANEAIGDFLYKIKDKFNTIFNTHNLNDRITLDSYSNKSLFLRKLKTVDFVDIKDIYTSKPENFSGLYVKYLADLELISSVTMKQYRDTLGTLNIAIGEFIHNYESKAIVGLYGLSKFKESEGLLEKNRKVMAGYFPVANGKSKAFIRDVYNSLGDFETIYNQLSILDKALSKEEVERALKLAQETSNLIDLLININRTSNVLDNNNKVKKDLMNGVYIAAKEVEFINYLYSNFVIVNGVFKNNIDDILNFLK